MPLAIKSVNFDAMKSPPDSPPNNLPPPASGVDPFREFHEGYNPKGATVTFSLDVDGAMTVNGLSIPVPDVKIPWDAIIQARGVLTQMPDDVGLGSGVDFRHTASELRAWYTAFKSV